MDEAPRSTASTVVIGLTLVAAVFANVFVVFRITSPLERVSLSLFTIAVIVWAASMLGWLRRLIKRGMRPYERRFNKLRNQVDLLLDHIRRLNGMALDQKRGFRDPMEAEKEMDQIEEQLIALVRKFRESAGAAE